ncbi:MAG TPA: hypothetical protein VFF52_29335 [Isosphaeraceae bacterium]|nr:hypothetical protein [Isosphaeraceae bacterium]
MRTTLDPTDPRLQLLVDVLDGVPRGPGPELESSWVRSPPRGIALIRDRRLVVIAPGDGAFEVHRFWSGWRFALGRIPSLGAAIVVFDPTNGDEWAMPPRERPEKSPRDQRVEREGLERLVSRLARASPGRSKGSPRVLRVGAAPARPGARRHGSQPRRFPRWSDPGIRWRR